MEIKNILVKGFGIRHIAKESDEEEAIRNEIDDRVFFYVPDEIFNQDNSAIEQYVNANVF